MWMFGKWWFVFNYKYSVGLVLFFVFLRNCLVPLLGLSVVVHYICQRWLGSAVSVVVVFV